MLYSERTFKIKVRFTLDSFRNSLHQQLCTFKDFCMKPECPISSKLQTSRI